MAPFNKFNKVLKPIALSNTRFYEKILGKYRKNKMINSGFPILVSLQIQEPRRSAKNRFQYPLASGVTKQFFLCLNRA